MPERPLLKGLAAGLGLLLAGAAQAEHGFPDFVRFPPQVRLDPDQRLVEEALGEAEFVVDAAGQETATKRGRHYVRWLRYVPGRGEPAVGYDNGTEERIFEAMRAPLEAAGWRLVYVNDTKSSFVMRLQADGRDRWATVKMDGPQAQVNLEMVEVGGAARLLTLNPPAARPERVADTDDLPYLPPPPGSTRTGEGRGDGPLDVTRPGSGDEPALVGLRVVSRNYQGPRTLSSLQFIGDYRAALLEAGWQVLYPASETEAAQYGSLAAHYARDGRDVWAKLTYQYGAQISLAVVDTAADDWGARFDRECRLPLYGVFFDFDKAQIKPGSEPVLEKAAALLAGRAGVKVEVQGHTDDVGGDTYNLRLSDARAASVRQWLVQHRVEAARLTSKGYGKGQPVADNGSDAGRARNRRVELARSGCPRR